MEKVGRFDGGQSGVPSFIAAFGACAVDRLVKRVGGQDAEDHRHGRGRRDAGETGADRRGNVLEMGCLAAHDTSEAEDGVVFSLPGDSLCRLGQFERAGAVNDINGVFVGSVSAEAVECSVQETPGDKFVEPADDESEPVGRCRQVTFNDRGHTRVPVRLNG